MERPGSHGPIMKRSAPCEKHQNCGKDICTEGGRPCEVLQPVQSGQPKEQIAEVAPSQTFNLVNPIVTSQTVNSYSSVHRQGAEGEAAQQDWQEIEIRDAASNSGGTDKHTDKNADVDEVVGDNVEAGTRSGFLHLQSGDFAIYSVQSDGEQEEQ
jgi:hypothetical protein